VDHVLGINPSLYVPAPIAKFISKLLEGQVKDLLQDLTEEVERQVNNGCEQGELREYQHQL
jgi:hypothetical protein